MSFQALLRFNMISLEGNGFYLRALEPEDLEFVYAVENDQTMWHVSHAQTPCSRFFVRQYLENAQQDIYEAKQLRLAICRAGNFQAIGLIDLFDFDPKNQRAGVGIIIGSSTERGKGAGSEALKLLIDYAFTSLNLHQLYANIDVNNESSTSLFAKFGFQKVGVKKDWNLIEGVYRDEALYQLVKSITK